MSRQVIVNVHSTQKYHETGYGSISKAVPGGKDMTAEEVAAYTKKLRDEQNAENADYKRRKASGEAIPVRYFKRVTSAAPGAQHAGRDSGLAAVADTGAIVQPVIVQPIVAPFTGARPEVAAQVNRTPFELRLDPGTGNTMYVIGSTKRGKSTAIMKIYDRYYADKKIVSILWTESPQIALYRRHENLIVAGINAWDRDADAIVQTQHKIQTKTKNAYRFLNILDDVPHVRGSQTIEKMFMIYRNSKMSCIVSMQATKQLMKCCRGNASNVLLFGANDDESIEAIIRCYLMGYLKSIGVKDISDQINWYKAATADHAFIYLHPNDGSVSFHRFQL